MKYSPQFKILFKWNPVAQCILGQFFGWQMVFDAIANSRKYEQDDKVEFKFNRQSDFNKCFNHIHDNFNRLTSEWRDKL